MPDACGRPLQPVSGLATVAESSSGLCQRQRPRLHGALRWRRLQTPLKRLFHLFSSLSASHHLLQLPVCALASTRHPRPVFLVLAVTSAPPRLRFSSFGYLTPDPFLSSFTTKDGFMSIENLKTFGESLPHHLISLFVLSSSAHQLALVQLMPGSWLGFCLYRGVDSWVKI